MGKVIFSTNQKLFARGIRWLTKSKVSHASFLMADDVVTQSTFLHGVGFEDFEEFKQKQTMIKIFEIEDEDYQKACNLFLADTGIKYGYFDIIYLAISLPLKRLIKFKNPIQDGLVCSEYTSLYIDACCGTKLNSSSYPPTPQDLLEWCESNLKLTSYK